MNVSADKKKKFHAAVYRHFKTHKRDLLWRHTKDPYKILVSEIMLQQTQVPRVMDKYPSFVKRFPDFHALRRATVREVLHEWKGLGYNRRALLLKKTADSVAEKYGGKLPDDFEELQKLPGIGRSTAGGVCAFAFNMPVLFIETNIRRAYIHHFFQKRKKVNDEDILSLLEKTMDKKDPRKWYSALMDYGSLLGKTTENPNRRSAHYAKQPKFDGSRRQLRGKVLSVLSGVSGMSGRGIARHLDVDIFRINEVLAMLEKEAFLACHGKIWSIAGTLGKCGHKGYTGRKLK